MLKKQTIKPNSVLLKDVFPILFEDWDDELNIRDKNLITIGSNKFKVYWKCKKCSYSWEQKVSNRVKHQTQCLICSKEEKLISFRFPEIYDEIDLEKNLSINPKTLLIASQKKIWWKCKKCSHTWEQSIETRIKLQTKCKICSNREKLFIKSHPHLLFEWDYEKNEGIDPNILLSGSNISVWWKCDKCKTSFKAQIYRRTKNYSQCGKCRIRINKNIPVFEKFPELSKEWNWSKNINLNPTKLSTGSNVFAWWNCKNGHSYSAQIYEKTTNKSGCPYCRGLKIDSSNSLKTLRPDLCLEWDYKLNLFINPDEVPLNSIKKVNWICKFGHTWISSIGNRSKKKGTTCPICSGRSSIHETSFGFLHPELLKEWDYENNSIDPLKIRPGSHKLINWKCSEGHNWETPLYSRVSGSFGCPFCSGRFTSYEKSIGFLKPPFMDEWDESKNKHLNPYTISLNSDIKVWWQCNNEKNHYWKTRVGARTGGTGCPYCAGTNIILNRYIRNSKSKLTDEINLYYLIFFNETECFYKIGITKTTIEERYRLLFTKTGYKILKYKIIKDKIKEVINIEQTTHKMVTRNLDSNLVRYIPQKYFGGIGESYYLPIELEKYKNSLQVDYVKLDCFVELDVIE